MAESNSTEAPLYREELSNLSSAACTATCYADAIAALMRPMPQNPHAVAAILVVNRVAQLLSDVNNGLEAVFNGASPRANVRGAIEDLKEAEASLYALQGVLGDADGYGALSEDEITNGEEDPTRCEPFCSSVSLIVFFRQELAEILRRAKAVYRKTPEPLKAAA